MTIGRPRQHHSGQNPDFQVPSAWLLANTYHRYITTLSSVVIPPIHSFPWMWKITNMTCTWYYVGIVYLLPPPPSPLLPDTITVLCGGAEGTGRHTASRAEHGHVCWLSARCKWIISVPFPILQKILPIPFSGFLPLSLNSSPPWSLTDPNGKYKSAYRHSIVWPQGLMKGDLNHPQRPTTAPGYTPASHCCYIKTYRVLCIGLFLMYSAAPWAAVYIITVMHIMDLELLCSITFNYTHLKFIKAEMWLGKYIHWCQLEL